MRRSERGMAFFYVFLAIAVMALLTYTVTRIGKGSTALPESAARREQVTRLVEQAALISSAIQQMIGGGADATAIASNLSTITGGNTWDTGPHRYKIYHPYGGGVKYMSQAGTGSALSDDNIADNFQVRTGSYVKGVGATDAGGSPAYPDILFTARVFSLEACQAINTAVNGAAATATPPTVEDATSFSNLFTNTTGATNATLEDTTPTCTNCLNITQSCVRDSGGTAFGYYQVLLPG
jgi:hypothetical protein